MITYKNDTIRTIACEALSVQRKPAYKKRRFVPKVITMHSIRCRHSRFSQSPEKTGPSTMRMYQLRLKSSHESTQGKWYASIEAAAEEIYPEALDS